MVAALTATIKVIDFVGETQAMRSARAMSFITRCRHKFNDKSTALSHQREK